VNPAQCSICGKLSFARGWCKAHYLRWYKHGDPLAGGTATNAPTDWLRDHICHIGDGCLIWPFARKPSGYAEIRWDDKATLATRVMCTLAHGNPPTPEHEAAHSCGKGHEGCIHPQHLRWATHVENEADKLIHGTRLRGEQKVTSKLTTDQVKEIRSLRGQLKQREIASIYGVTRQTIGDILNARKWAWMQEQAE